MGATNPHIFSNLSKINVFYTLLLSFTGPISGFLIIPYTGFHLHYDLNVSFAMIGLITSIALFIQFSGSIFMLNINKYLSCYYILLIGLLIRLIALVMFICYLDNIVMLVTSVLLITISGALYIPTTRSLLVDLVHLNKRKNFLISLQSSFITLGRVSSTFLSSLAIHGYAARIIIGCIVLYLLIFTILMIFVKHRYYLLKFYQKNIGYNYFKLIITYLKSPIVVTLLVMQVSIYCIFLTYKIFAPIYISKVLNTHAVIYIFSLNSVFLIILQLSIYKIIVKFNYIKLFCYAFIFAILAFYCMNFTSLWIFIFSSFLLACSEVILTLGTDLQLSKFASRDISCIFAIIRLGGGLGALFGNLLTGNLLTYLNNNWTGVWLVLIIISVLSVMYCIFSYNRQKQAI